MKYDKTIKNDCGSWKMTPFYFVNDWHFVLVTYAQSVLNTYKKGR